MPRNLHQRSAETKHGKVIRVLDYFLISSAKLLALPKFLVLQIINMILTMEIKVTNDLLDFFVSLISYFHFF